MRQVILLGCPRTLGGGCVESGHVALLWRKMGWSVTVIATAEEASTNPWPERLRAAGCKVVLDNLSLRGVTDCTCVSFCCAPALRAWPKLSRLGVKLIWAPCMTIVPPGDRLNFRVVPPTAAVFQSEYQAKKLGPIY